MKKIATLDISFREYKDNICYYNVLVEMQQEKIHIVLPRYHTFLGWIEIFGLPPQNEWVVLDDINPFTKIGELVVNEQAITETVRYTKNISEHAIHTTRTLGEQSEDCVWTQNYAEAPTNIASIVTFTHDQGTYETQWKTEVLENQSLLTQSQSDYVAEVTKTLGQPDLLIRKTFATTGVIPPLYYSLFPIHNLLQLEEMNGSVIEVGYLDTNSEHTIDTVHGRWSKQFDFGNKKLYIHETNYSSRQIETSEGLEQIKDTYRKELFIEV